MGLYSQYTFALTYNVIIFSVKGFVLMFYYRTFGAYRRFRIRRLVCSHLYRQLVHRCNICCHFPMHSCQRRLELAINRPLHRFSGLSPQQRHTQCFRWFCHCGHAHADHMEASATDEQEDWCPFHLFPRWHRRGCEHIPAYHSPQCRHKRLLM